MDKLKYIAKRLAMAAVMMLLITVVVFIVIQLPPGDFVGPFVYGYKIERDKYENKIFVEDTEHLHQVQFFVKGTSYKLLGLIPSDRHLFGVDDSNLEEGEEPAQIMLFGADKLGRDLYSRVLLGRSGLSDRSAAGHGDLLRSGRYHRRYLGLLRRLGG